MDPAALLLTSSLLGDPPAAGDAAASGFELELALDLWMPRLEGAFTDTGAAGGEVDVRDLDVHDTEAVFAGALRLTRERVQVELRGFSFATEGRGQAVDAFTLGGLTVAAGDTIDSSFSWWTAGAEVSYEAYRPYHDGANGTHFALFVLGSLDVQSVSRDIRDITSGGVTTAREAFFAAEMGGGFRLAFDAKAGFPLFRRAEIAARAGVGLSVPMDDGELGGATRVEATFTGWLGERLSLYGGYRLMGASLTGEELEMTTSLQGLMAGFRYEF